MTTKCPCGHCGMNIGFRLEEFQDGLTVECPHCKKMTVLFLPPPPASEKIILDQLARSKAEKTEQEKTQAIINSLESIGSTFFLFGIIGMAIALVGLFIAAANGENAQSIGAIFVAGLIALGQGIIIQTLFKAAAEAIHLLRTIAKK